VAYASSLRSSAVLPMACIMMKIAMCKQLGQLFTMSHVGQDLSRQNSAWTGAGLRYLVSMRKTL